MTQSFNVQLDRVAALSKRHDLVTDGLVTRPPRSAIRSNVRCSNRTMTLVSS